MPQSFVLRRSDRLRHESLSGTNAGFFGSIVLAGATITALVAVGVLTTPRLSAQSRGASAKATASLEEAERSRAAFDVASVKRNTSGDLRVIIQAPAGGRFTATNVPLRALIRYRLGAREK